MWGHWSWWTYQVYAYTYVYVCCNLKWHVYLGSKSCSTWLLKVYAIIVILTAHLHIPEYELSDKYDFIEIFSGSARCARLGRFIRWKVVAIDAAYDQAMDMNKSGGFVWLAIASAILFLTNS